MFMRKIYKFLIAGVLGFSGLNVAAQYCYASGPFDCSGAWNIDLVKLSGENGSAINRASNCEAYADNTAEFAYLLAGNTYTVTVSTTSAISNVAVFVDWNNDNILNDTTEIVPGVATLGADASLLLIPPMGTTDGPKRMRVRAVSYIGVPSSCGEQTFGEVEDYTLYFYNEADSIPTVSGPAGTYCTAGGPANCAQLDGSGTGYPITKVEITGDNGTKISNPSSCDMYGDYTAQSVTLSVGSPYTLAVTGGNAFGVTVTWIDWNEDFDFSDPGEEYAEYNYNIALDALVTVITPPVDVVPGIKRMRIRAEGILPPEPCGIQAIGEVEDYTVIVFNPLTPTPDCATGFSPADSATKVCQNTRLSWTAVTDAAQYKLKLYNASSGTTVLDTVITPNNLTLTNLSVSTNYKWLVIPVDADGVSAIGCDTLLFTTAANPDPSVLINSGVDSLTVCADNDLFLDATVQDGTGPYEYLWTGDDESHFDFLDTITPTYHTAAAGSYKILVQATDANGCAATDTAVVHVYPNPVISKFESVKSAYCEGETGSLKLITDGTSQFFFKSFDQVNYASTSLVYQGDSVWDIGMLTDSVWYRIAVANLYGCGAVAETGVIVHPTPDTPVIVADKLSFCPGDSAQLEVSNYSTGLTWSNGTTSSKQTVKASGDFTVTYVDSFGCSSSSDTTHITKNPAPTNLVIKVLESSLCAGETATLYLENNSSNSVLWNDGTTTGDSLKVTTGGTYSLVATNSFGCSAQANAPSPVFHPIPAKPSIAGVTKACDGKTIPLTANGSGSYSWSTGESTAKINVTAAGTYSVKVVSSFGCESDTASATVEFEALPDAVTISQVGDSMFVNPQDSQYKYRWYKANGQFLKETTGAYKPTASGKYKVVVVSAFGCFSDTSVTFTFAGVGINKVSEQGQLKVYPQPAKDRFMIDLPIVSGQYHLTILDLTGKLIFEKTMNSGLQEIIGNWSSGSYVIRAESQDEILTIPLIIE